MNLLGWLRQVQRKQISDHRRTHKLQEKHVQKQRPQRIEKSFKNHRFWLPKWLQNRSNIAPRGLSEAAGAPRRTQEQQTANKKTPRASQERSKSTRKRFSRVSRPRGGPNFGPKGWPAKLGGRVLERSAPWNGVFAWRVCRCSCFRGSSKKWPPLKLKQALANLN